LYGYTTATRDIFTVESTVLAALVLSTVRIYNP